MVFSSRHQIRHLTVALLPFRRLNNGLPFSAYSYLHGDRSWPPPHTGLIPPKSLESFLFSRQRSPPRPAAPCPCVTPSPHSNVPARLPPAPQHGVHPEHLPVEERVPHRVGQELLAAIPPLLPRAASSLEGDLALQRPPCAFPLCLHASAHLAYSDPLSLVLQAGKLRQGAVRSAARLRGLLLDRQLRAAVFLSKMAQITSWTQRQHQVLLWFMSNTNLGLLLAAWRGVAWEPGWVGSRLCRAGQLPVQGGRRGRSEVPAVVQTRSWNLRLVHLYWDLMHLTQGLESVIQALR